MYYILTIPIVEYNKKLQKSEVFTPRHDLRFAKLRTKNNFHKNEKLTVNLLFSLSV